MDLVLPSNGALILYSYSESSQSDSYMHKCLRLPDLSQVQINSTPLPTYKAAFATRNVSSCRWSEKINNHYDASLMVH